MVVVDSLVDSSNAWTCAKRSHAVTTTLTASNKVELLEQINILKFGNITHIIIIIKVYNNTPNIL